MDIADKSFFTVATGKKYLDYAYTLARSYKYHNDLKTPFYIVTSSALRLPKDLSWVKVSVRPEINKNLEYKFNFWNLSPTAEAVFIDSDSIIYGNIAGFFEQLNAHSVNVVGIKINTGIWADLDAAATTAEYNLAYLIRYCGALYYIRKDGTGSDICNYAKLIYKNNTGFQRHNHGVNEEPVMSIAMARYQVNPIKDTGNIWGDTAQMDKGSSFSVLNKKPRFINLKNNINYKFWMPEGFYSPAVLHMGGNIHNKNPWIFDSIRLKLVYRYKLKKEKAEFIVSRIVFPAYFLLKKMKNIVTNN